MKRPDMHAKTLLIIGAGIEQVPGIQLAKKLGLFVVSVDGNPQAPGLALSDDYGVVSTYDVVGNALFAKKYSKQKRNIDGVMTLASDVPMTVAAVAQALGLPGHTLVTAHRTSDKLLMKRVLKKHHIAIPAFASVKIVADVKRFARTHGYPVVIKPVDSRGARGVQRLVRAADLAKAISIARKESPTHRVMVEAFLAGSQYSTESLIYDGKIVTTGLAHRNYEYLERFAPFIIENGGELPADLSRSQRTDVDRLLLRTAKALGMKRGSIKGDIVWTEDGPYIIEVAARISGGYFATDTVPLSTGVDLVTQVIFIALGLAPDFKALKPKYTKYVCQRFFFPSGKGVIRDIKGIEKAKAIHEVKRFALYVKKGDVVRGIVSHPSRGGYVTTVASTPARARATAERAIATVRFVIS